MSAARRERDATDCQVCGRARHPASFRVTFWGAPYNSAAVIDNLAFDRRYERGGSWAACHCVPALASASHRPRAFPGIMGRIAPSTHRCHTTLCTTPRRDTKQRLLRTHASARWPQPPPRPLTRSSSRPARFGLAARPHRHHPASLADPAPSAGACTWPAGSALRCGLQAACGCQCPATVCAAACPNRRGQGAAVAARVPSPLIACPRLAVPDPAPPPRARTAHRRVLAAAALQAQPAAAVPQRPPPPTGPPAAAEARAVAVSARRRPGPGEQRGRAAQYRRNTDTRRSARAREREQCGGRRLLHVEL